MNEGDVGAVLREALLVTLKLGGPMLIAMLAIGLIVSVLQAATQISEATLVFLPKVAALCLMILLLGSFMMTTLGDFAALLFDRMVAIGGM